jgi:hypothetical protein
MSGALPMSDTSDADFEKSKQSIDSFDTLAVPDSDFGDAKLYSQDGPTVSPQTHTPQSQQAQERNTVVSSERGNCCCDFKADRE